MLPSQTDLEQLFVQKYGNERGDVTGWGPRQRSRFGYYLPGDVYEALIRRLVFPGCSWILQDEFTGRAASEFSAHGFEEAAFAYLDDLSTWLLYRRLNYIEIQAWRLFRALGLPYPENCLLGIYRKR